jgi:anti-sigma factor RsiW
MEHEESYQLMMAALDEELDQEGQRELEAHLQGCTHCRVEWQTLQAVHTLLLQAPLLSPAVGFAQRTVARLPNRRARVWTMAMIYALLLVGGLLPILLVGLLLLALAPLFSNPTIVSSIGQSIVHVFQVLGTVMTALLAGLAELLMQQPAIVGWLLVLLGVVALWGGVSRQLIFQANPRQIS